MADEDVRACEACGASVYPEHIDKKIAGYHGGRILCPHCYADSKKAESAEASAEERLDPISLDDDISPSSPSATAIHGFSGADSLAGGGVVIDDESKYKRRLDPRSPFGTRCRTFHAKLSEGAVGYLNEQLNTWTDVNPDVNIKFATSTIGIFEGKHSDPHLIITVFY